MPELRSARGEVRTFSIRRTESFDAEGITALIHSNRTTVNVFGRINVIHLLEKATLAVSLIGDNGDVMAQACFSDHPISGLVDQAEWEEFLQNTTGSTRFKPQNTLFLHLFVSEAEFAVPTAMEIIRAVFRTVPELCFILLLSPHQETLDPALMEIFKPLETKYHLDGVAQVCSREQHCPRLQIRPARVEDHDDVMKISDHTQPQSGERPFFMAELIQSQDGVNAVCLSDGRVVGFITVTTKINLMRMQQHYHLHGLEGAFPQGDGEERRRAGQSEREEEERDQSEGRAGQTDQSQGREEQTDQSEWREGETDESQGREGQTDQLGKNEKESGQSDTELETGPVSSEQQPDEELSHRHRAFSIQFFCIDRSVESRSVDFMPYLFEHFPGRELCFIFVPPLTPEMPLLQSFTRVSPRSGKSPPQELYALHLLSLRPLQVRRASPLDRNLIEDLVQGLEHRDFLMKDLDQFYLTETDQDRVPIQAFVVQADTQLVGIVVIGDEHNVEYLRAHYNIEDFIYFSHHSYMEHAALRHFVLRRPLQPHSRLVLRETLRLGHKSCLYLRVYPPHSPVPQTSCIDQLDILLDSSVPVRPRPQIIFPLEELGINSPSNQITELQPPFALHLLSRKLSLEQKVTVNARLLVVGASDTGLSILTTLCCWPHLRFNNLTLVSKHGLCDDEEDTAGFLSTSHAFSSRDLSLLPLSQVKVVSGTLVSIDRKSKHVRVLYEGVRSDWLPYDILVLCTGLQYQEPLTVTSVPPPRNLWTLNGPQDCARFKRWVQEELLHSHDHVVVHGDSIDAFTSVQALLSLGLTGHRISLVLGPSESESWIPDSAVDQAVGAYLQKVHVQVYRGSELLRVQTEEDLVTAVTLSYRGEMVEICCGVLLSLSSPRMDPSFLRSVLGSFLVVDEGLVVDRSFHTSDHWILAAGPCTRISRRYHTDEWSHQRFCSAEVGEDLARRFDPTEEPRAEGELLPIYQKPKVTGGLLPGGLHYLHVTKPTLSKTSSVQYLKDSPLLTGRPECGTYFCLHLNHCERVETVTCASFEPLPLRNLLCLYGLHQSLLGNISARLSLGQVSDLYSFFRQPWCLAICHDRFPDFQQELRVLTKRSATSATQAGAEGRPEEGGSEEFPDQLSREERDFVRKVVIRYLRYNHNLLPMFSTPGQM